VAPHPADHPGPFALVADLDEPELAPEDRHHLERVLRLRPGAPMVVGDGLGRWRPARFGDRLEPTGPIEAVPRAKPPLAVGFALVKAGKPELVVQKLTELGIDRIAPFRASRSVVQWDADRAAKAVRRLRAVARAAAQQCHRPWVPEVTDVTDLAGLLAAGDVAIADRSGDPPSLERPFVLVGPEGGWSDEELAEAAAAGVPRVGLGEHVLRAETAAVTLGGLLAGLRTGIIGPR
jgi:16S rRNA (uracil1498-N3)-methyltransferase